MRQRGRYQVEEHLCSVLLIRIAPTVRSSAAPSERRSGRREGKESERAEPAERCISRMASGSRSPRQFVLSFVVVVVYSSRAHIGVRVSLSRRSQRASHTAAPRTPFLWCTNTPSVRQRGGEPPTARSSRPKGFPLSRALADAHTHARAPTLPPVRTRKSRVVFVS